MSLLIVDDVQDNVVLLHTLLTNAGYKDIHAAASAREAYQFLGINQPADALMIPQVDLILMDVMMPEISGIEACQTIKKVWAYHDVPIVMVTAKTDMQCLQDSFAAGAVDFITKPIRKIELLSRVHSCLRLKGEIEQRKKHEIELLKKNKELQTAMNEIKTLQGFLPICAFCKKIRDVKGYWQQLEAYISKHSEAKFSHGVCEECVKIHYPDLKGAA